MKTLPLEVHEDMLYLLKDAIFKKFFLVHYDSTSHHDDNPLPIELS